MKKTKKIYPPLQFFFAPSPPLKNYQRFLSMTSRGDSHTTTDVKPEIIPGVQTGNGIPHDKYYICSIAHARTNRKDGTLMQRQLYIGEAHTALDIPLFILLLFKIFLLQIPVFK